MRKLTEEEKILSREKMKETSRKWQRNNKEKAYINHKNYRDKRRDELNRRAKEWRENNREVHLERRRNRTKQRKEENPIFRLSENIRSLISLSFKRGKLSFEKKLRTEEILGCGIEDFISYILSKCPSGVTLCDFHRYGYQIDHIIPISSATTEKEVVLLNHYTNFQPLFWKENIRKRDKILI
jgi:hypothetical protein